MFTQANLGDTGDSFSVYCNKLSYPFFCFPVLVKLIFTLHCSLLSMQQSYILGFPGGSDSKEFPSIRETWVQSLSSENPLEEGMATHSSILAWRIPMDRGAWLSTIQRITKNQTWLRQLSMHNSRLGHSSNGDVEATVQRKHDEP